VVFQGSTQSNQYAEKQYVCSSIVNFCNPQLNHAPDEQLMNTIVAALAQVNSDPAVVKRAIDELEDRGFKV
jgi:hypothetical protein